MYAYKNTDFHNMTAAFKNLQGLKYFSPVEHCDMVGWA